MAFDDDETRGLLVETTRRFLDDRAPVSTVRARLDAPQGWDPDVWRDGAALGWVALAVPEALGGLAADRPRLGDLAAVAAEIGRVVLPAPFVPTVVTAAAVAERASTEQREVVDGLVGGDLTAGWSFDPATTLSIEAGDGDGVRVRGVQRLVPEAATAGVLLLTARDGDGWSQLLVPAATPGIAIEPLDGLDLTRRLADVAVDATLSAAALLGGRATAAAAIERQLDLAVVLQAAEAAGAAGRLLEVTVAYARDRVAFGRPIGSYQAIKHLLAELLLDVEVAQAAVSHAVAVVEAGGDDRAVHRAASIAKAAAHDAATTVVEGCLQVHGGIGFTWEHDVHLYLRRVVANAGLLGTVAWHRDRVAHLVGMDGDDNAVATEPSEPGPGDELVLDDAEAAWRDELRRWLPAHLPRQAAVDDHSQTEESERAEVARTRELQATIADAGYAALTIPVAYGGAGLTLRHQQIFDAETAGYERALLFRVPTLAMIAPTLLAHGTEEQKRTHLPRMIHGEELWVQLMSEPSGGSDLAGAVTRATRDGDVFVVSGQKVWSTGANHVDFGLCLVRTDPDVPKHRGLTVLIVPMRSPGVTAVPIRQINGQAEFCEVFLDDVVVPVANVVGAIDDGWTVASTLLVHERGAAGQTRRPNATADTVHLARVTGVSDDARARQLVARMAENDAVERVLVATISAEMARGEKPSTAGSLVKLFRARKAQFAGHAAMDVAGADGVAWRGTDGTRWSDDYLNSRARSIAGGTSEMQRNIISERVLGLPREAQPDRDLPFREVRSNALPARSVPPV